MNRTMTATRLRIVLLIGMLILIAAMVVGFVLVQRSLTGYANTISQLNADAETGDQSILTLRALEGRLDKEKTAIESARSITADGATYADKVVSDITRIATQSGVSIASFEFVDAAAAPSTTAPATPTTPAVGGVSKKAVSVTLQSPVRYSSLMSFIEGIETNDLKMQIATVAMTKAEKDTVGTQTFSIEVYVR